MVPGVNDDQAALAAAGYIGATAGELAGKTIADKIVAMLSQRTLLRRHGRISLYRDRLVLGSWTGSGDLVLPRRGIRAVDARFTQLYGRFTGGLLNAGKPLIIDTVDAGQLYLLIDRREFMETTDDRRWARLLANWLASPA
jgi:hypothetical protein